MPPTDKYRVIHIDDEHEQLFFAKTFLEEADPAIEVISVMNSDELLEALDEKIDCIVSDYVMPEMDGMEVCRLVKERSSVPYVIYTGRGSEVVAEAAFNSGVDDYYIHTDIEKIYCCHFFPFYHACRCGPPYLAA